MGLADVVGCRGPDVGGGHSRGRCICSIVVQHPGNELKTAARLFSTLPPTHRQGYREDAERLEDGPLNSNALLSLSLPARFFHQWRSVTVDQQVAAPETLTACGLRTTACIKSAGRGR